MSQYSRIIDRFEKGKIPKNFEDEEGNRLAHLAAFARRPGVYPGESVKNIFGLSPKSIRDFLDPPAFQGSVPIFRRQTKRFEEISPSTYAKQFKSEYLDTIQFQSSHILHKVIRKTMLRIGKEEIATENNWILAMCGENMRKKTIPNVLIRWINPLVGYGVFAAADIPELTYIGEYTGVIRRRKRIVGDSHNDYIFGYTIGPKETPYIIDAEKRGNFTRFINHSDEANIFSRWGIYDSTGHIFLLTNRRIKQGEQLTYEYGPHYWKRRPPPIDLP
jgi:uncharacterized protein